MTHIRNKNRISWLFTCCDVLVTKYHLLCYTASHTDVHLSKKLRARLAPPVILWKHGHLKQEGCKKFNIKRSFSHTMNKWIRCRLSYMSQTGASGHDGGLVDWHGVFGVVSHDCVTRFVICCNDLVLLVDFCTPPLGAFGGWKVRFKRQKNTKNISLIKRNNMDTNPWGFCPWQTPAPSWWPCLCHQLLPLGRLG